MWIECPVFGGRPGPFERVPVLVHENDAARRDPGEVDPLGIDQEAASRQHHREVVADAFVHLKASGHTESGGEIDSGLNHVLAIVVVIEH